MTDYISIKLFALSAFSWSKIAICHLTCISKDAKPLEHALYTEKSRKIWCFNISFYERTLEYLLNKAKSMCLNIVLQVQKWSSCVVAGTGLIIELSHTPSDDDKNPGPNYTLGWRKPQGYKLSSDSSTTPSPASSASLSLSPVIIVTYSGRTASSWISNEMLLVVNVFQNSFGCYSNELEEGGGQEAETNI